MKKLLPVFLCAVLAIAAIDITNLDNYANQPVPAFITKNSTPVNNAITDAGATLGRVLFYDRQLSLNNTIACGSCHHQEFAFSDTALLSKGFMGGFTGRHAMRLGYARFSNEEKFFWDERAISLEDQTTRPIQDAVEMGFSGTNGQPAIDSLIRKLSALDYYNKLFLLAYGDMVITEDRMQQSLAQFVRSIYSFDSKFDQGLAQTNGNLLASFPNFTNLENTGKTLFIAPPGPGGGLGCQGCHNAPEFDIDPNTQNNGVIGNAATPGSLDLTNTRAPSLRDIFNQQGELNSPLMHNGAFDNIQLLINHYNQVPQLPANTNLDPRLAGPGGNLQLNQNQRAALEAFLKTLTSADIYTNPKWSDPFDANGELELINSVTAITEVKSWEITLYPNPAADFVTLDLEQGDYTLRVFNNQGKLLMQQVASGNIMLELSGLTPGILILLVEDDQGVRLTKRFLKI